MASLAGFDELALLRETSALNSETRSGSFSAIFSGAAGLTNLASSISLRAFSVSFFIRSYFVIIFRFLRF